MYFSILTNWIIKFCYQQLDLFFSKVTKSYGHNIYITTSIKECLGFNSKPLSVDKPPKNNTKPSDSTGVRARPGGAPVNGLLSVVDVKLQLDQGGVHLLHFGVPPGTLPFSLHYLALLKPDHGPLWVLHEVLLDELT